MTVHLAPTDINLVDNDPRILDLRLAEALAFALPYDIRKLIRRNEEELASYGGVFATVAKTTRDGGRPGQEYWLNEAQALLACMFARTDNAAEVRRALIAVFMEWRRRRAAEPQTALAAPPRPVDPFGDEALQASSLKLALVREARQIFGPARARGLWARLGLPAAEPRAAGPAEAADEAEGRACLAHLLARRTAYDSHWKGGAREMTLAQEIDEAVEGDEDCRVSLMFRGLRIEERGGENFFWVPNRGQWVADSFAGTRWAGNWRFALKRLPGVESSGPYKVEGITARGTLIPEALLEPALMPCTT